MMKRMIWKAQSPPSSSFSAADRSGSVSGHPTTSIPAGSMAARAFSSTGSVKDE